MNVNTSLGSETDGHISTDTLVLLKRKLSMVVFGSEVLRNKEDRVDVEVVSVSTGTEDDGTKTAVPGVSDFQVYQIPSVKSSALLPVRNQETDILVKRCVDFIVVVKLE